MIEIRRSTHLFIPSECGKMEPLGAQKKHSRVKLTGQRRDGSDPSRAGAIPSVVWGHEEEAQKFMEKLNGLWVFR
jgi:hypothetical protein